MSSPGVTVFCKTNMCNSVHDAAYVLAELNARCDAALDAGDRSRARALLARMMVFECVVDASPQHRAEILATLRRLHKDLFRRVDHILGVARPLWWVCGRGAPEVSAEDLVRAVGQAVLE
jgi:hypothetical protein